MKYTFRVLSSEADKHLMFDLVRRFPEGNLHVCDMAYRLSSWALDDPKNVRLWFNQDGDLSAWAVMQTPFWTIDYIYHPACEQDLHPDILAWADERAKAIYNAPSGHPTWYINVFSDQSCRIHDLEAHGFQRQSDKSEDYWSKVFMCRASSTPVRVYPPPQGFTVRSLAGKDEVEAYVQLHQAVFETKNMTLEWRRRILDQPNYRPDLDVVVESPDSRLVAFCICWQDPITLDGRVEPLGCHKDFRQYALGRVALSEGLHRLVASGARKIYVETGNERTTALRLYEFFDFQVIRDVLMLRKDYMPG